MRKNFLPISKRLEKQVPTKVGTHFKYQDVNENNILIIKFD